MTDPRSTRARHPSYPSRGGLLGAPVFVTPTKRISDKAPLVVIAFPKRYGWPWM